MTPADLHGLHGPNVPLSQFSPTLAAPGPHPAADWWERMRGARWIKLLSDCHTVADAEVAHGWGLRVILRMAGEGTVHREAVLDAIARYAGVVDVIECGNEPVLTGLPGWQHAWYLEQISVYCSPAARAAGILLCTPGWQGATEPPGADDLGWRLHGVYDHFDLIGVHAYDANVLAAPAQLARLQRWAAAWDKPLLLTEYGIAHRVLAGQPDEAASDLEKARRYAAWLGALTQIPSLQGACAFLGGGTRTWAAFNDAADGYSPAGVNRYHLSSAAWQLLGALVDKSGGA